MKEKKPIAYDALKKDFIFVNLFAGAMILSTLVYMLLQRWGIFYHVPCLIHDLFHIYCLGCGGTRAIFALLQGRFLESLSYNPAVVLGALLILHYELGVILTLLKKNGKRYYCNNLTLVILFLVIIVIFAFVRNYLLIACGIDMLQDFIPS